MKTVYVVMLGNEIQSIFSNEDDAWNYASECEEKLSHFIFRVEQWKVN